MFDSFAWRVWLIDYQIAGHSFSFRSVNRLVVTTVVGCELGRSETEYKDAVSVVFQGFIFHKNET